MSNILKKCTQILARPKNDLTKRVERLEYLLEKMAIDIGHEDANKNDTLYPIDPPEILLEKIIEESRDKLHIQGLPKRAESLWNIGIASVQGNVRNRNEDYALAFELGRKYQIAIIADGCGGHLHGNVASYAAVCEAAISIIGTLGSAIDWFACNPCASLAVAIKDAGEALSLLSNKARKSVRSNILRTTLIMVIASEKTCSYGYIGDGGGYILRQDGEIAKFVIPQKEGGETSNILSSSLGPSIVGQPVFGSLPRKTGDLIIMGTDGIFDRVTPEFALDMLYGVRDFEGDLQMLVNKTLEEMAHMKGEHGFVFDDNITLAIIGGRKVIETPEASLE